MTVWDYLADRFTSDPDSARALRPIVAAEGASIRELLSTPQGRQRLTRAIHARRREIESTLDSLLTFSDN